MMKQLLIFFFVSIGIFAQAQNANPCQFDEYKKRFKNKVDLVEIDIQKSISETQSKSHTDVKTIPTVVHVIHNGGTENISDAQIQSQIEVLNEDFRKIATTLGDGNGVDTEIEFVLAKIDPNGNCTNGIVRVQSTLTNHKNYERAELANLSSWDASRYLNIYVVKTMQGSTLGYASFPGGPVNQDGCVMLHTAFGRVGTVVSPNNKGRTATHELGHWLGLYHTFNGGCGVDLCLDGDLVCDTPPVINPNFGCNTSANTCSNDVPDVNDQIRNYMDYTNDACKNMFTNGQKTRMHATLNTQRQTIWSESNLIATGCNHDYVSPACNVVADFTSNGDTICVGNVLRFTNKSLNNPLNYKWYFSGGIPEIATTQNATITYNSTGRFPVKLVVTGALGSDSITINNYVTVVNPSSGRTLPFFESFENSTFPRNGIKINNPDSDVTWERDDVAIAYHGLASAKINNLINTNYGQADDILLPAFDLSTGADTIDFTFNWAYAKSDVNYSDELVVLVSVDCGVNWTQVFYKTGTNLATGITQTTPYIPDETTVWKEAKINLLPYKDYNNVQIKIVNVTDGGNNLYIDNLNIKTNLDAIEDLDLKNSITIFPNPTKSIFIININNKLGEKLTVNLLDITGKVVFNDIRHISLENETYNLPANISKGVYFVELNIQNKIVHKKIIID